MMLESGEPEERMAMEAKEDNRRFKSSGRNLRQASLLLLWERNFLGKRKYDLLLDRE